MSRNDVAFCGMDDMKGPGVEARSTAEKGGDPPELESGSTLSRARTASRLMGKSDLDVIPKLGHPERAGTHRFERIEWSNGLFSRGNYYDVTLKRIQPV